MHKMPPLPNKKVNISAQNPLQIRSQQIPLPRRFNSIEKGSVSRNNLSSQKSHREETKPQSVQRKTLFRRRPVSARNNSLNRVNTSKDSVASRQSINSRGSVDKHRQSPRYSRKLRVSMPSISAHSWVMYEMNTEKKVCGKGTFKKREVASLTKIMNLTTMLHLLEQYTLTANKLRVMVSKDAASIPGTTAELRTGYQLSVEDLFYGMMLPSGNDAAHQIAQIGGVIIKMAKQNSMDKSLLYSCEALTQLTREESGLVGIYLHEMNNQARKLGMSRSNWATPHGLSNINSVSTCEDMAKVCMHAMKNQHFRDIVATKQYSCQVYKQTFVDGQEKVTKEWLKWENTNKMLQEGWSGIKTGITPNAGPCLAASKEVWLGGRSYHFLVILLRSDTMDMRWREVRGLVDWILTDVTVLS